MPDSSGLLHFGRPWVSSGADTPNDSPNSSASLAKRDMDEGALAGTVVGVVIGGALLAFCLYPVIVHYAKRIQRARKRKQHDAELAIPSANGDANALHRLSTADSIKEEATRGVEDFDPGVDSQVLNFARFDPKVPPSAYTPFDGEYMPQDMEDDQPGVLKGTSEDYYRPSIPSEAFGMVPMPDVPEDASPPIRPLSRTSTLSANVKHMFYRKSTRDRTLSSHTSSDDQSSSSAAYQVHGGAPPHAIVTNNEALAESPTQLSPATSHRGLSVTVSNQTTARSAVPRDALSASPPQSPSSDNWRKYSPSPQPPAPGTVNPMEIMAPSTQSEMWHRTEHQLLVSSHESSPNNRPTQDPPSDIDAAVSPTSIDAHATPMIGVSPQPASSDTALDHNEAADTVMGNSISISHSHLAPSTIPEDAPSSNFSERLTPFAGGATDASSSQPTPSTQTDTPSPESVNSSDFRHSVSPAPNHPNASPKPQQQGVFPCDEPGCSQVFDQPHKLK